MRQIPTVQSSSGVFRTIRLINAIFDPLEFWEERNRKYGDLYQIKFKNSPPTVVISNPQAVETIFTAPPDFFEVGRANKGLSFLVGDLSLLLLDGKAHKHRRRLLMPHFHGEYLQKFNHQIVDITKKVCQNLEINKSFKIRPVMQEITLRVILRVVFGIDSTARAERLRELLTALLETFNSPLSSSLLFFRFLQKDWGSFSPWGRFLRLQQDIRTLIYQAIKERRDLLASSRSDYRDILSLLLLAKQDNGESLSDEELHDELITLLFAGHETTASALAWLFYWVHYIPDIRDKLCFELDNYGRKSDYNVINNLPYLNAVISETLRIYPVGANAFARILTKPMSILGYNFEPKTWLRVSIYSLHHREDLYPNSKQFNPERFLHKTYSPYEYMPFGGGNRRCLGSALALLEIKLVTMTILSAFQLELTSKKPILPVRRGFTLAPPASLKMIVKNKKSR